MFPNESFSCLNWKYYNNKPDCIFNKSCQLLPNNINHFNTDLMENYVDVYNTPGINRGKEFPNCPQGFYPFKKKCIQLCRNCKTGICDGGNCYNI